MAQFGKNKVQYRKFEWRSISTKNFDIYYDDGSKYLAEFTSVEAEKAVIKIQTLINFKINKRIPIIIFDNQNEFQQNNVTQQYMSQGIQGFTEIFKNRVVLPFFGEYSQFRHVIHHELVHAVLNQYLYGGTFSTAVQTGNQIQFPLYMNEGLAEYSSLGGQDLQNDMFIRDLAISEKLGGLEMMNGYLAYRGGQTFYWYIATNYGEDKIAKLLYYISMKMPFDDVFRTLFKMSYKDFSEKWQKDLKKYYFPDIEKYKDPADFSQRITNHKEERNFMNASPAVSPDGTKLVYIADDGRTYNVYLKNLDTKKTNDENELSKPEKIISSDRARDFEELNLTTPSISWSPDGKRIVISAKHGGEDAIYIYDIKTKDYEVIQLGLPSISSVQWSPDGNKLCFVGVTKPFSDLYIYNLKSKQLDRLTNDAFTEASPHWSPDSKKIYFISERGENLDAVNDKTYIWRENYSLSEIYSINLDDQSIEKLSNINDGKITSLAITNDDKYILFVSDRSGIGNIYSLNINTKEVKPRTNSITGITQLSMSKDNSKLFYSSINNAGYDIFMIKYPLEASVPGDTIPFTKFKSGVRFKNLAIQQNETAADSSISAVMPNYGGFEVSMDKPDFIEKNSDAMSQNKDFVKQYVDEGLHQEKEYFPNFSLDGIMANPMVSSYYGGAVSGSFQASDVLGDHIIFGNINLYSSLKNSNIYLSYSYLPQIIDYNATAYHNTLLFRRRDMSIYRFRNFGTSLTAQLPFDKFSRIEAGMNIAGATMELVDVYNEGGAANNQSKFLLIPQVRYVYDNVLYGWYAPSDGTRFFVRGQAAPKFSKNDYSYAMLDADFRYYITFFDYLTVAARGTFGANFGSGTSNYFLGGIDNWLFGNRYNSSIPLDKPEDYIFMQFVTPLRGWSLGELSGSRYFATNFELRFPLFQALVAGPIPFLVQGVMGNLFCDIGGAWSGDWNSFRSMETDLQGRSVPKDLRISAGTGARAYLFGMPIKFDVAWTYFGHNWSQPIYLISLGYDF